MQTQAAARAGKDRAAQGGGQVALPVQSGQCQGGAELQPVQALDGLIAVLSLLASRATVALNRAPRPVKLGLPSFGLKAPSHCLRFE